MIALITVILIGDDLAAELRGRAVFERACGACHGDRGDGKGPGAKYVMPKPRDLTRGEYKFRSTPSGALPTDADLRRTLREGVPGTSMPAFKGLIADPDLRAVVAFLKSLSPRFAEEPPEPPVAIPPEPPDGPASRAAGKRLYDTVKCWECHGHGGRGDGPAASTLRDDAGDPIAAYDFTRPGRMKGGADARDVYRTLATGLSGTPMPSYADTIPPEDLWHLVHYVRSLVRRRTFLDWLAKTP